MAASIPVKLISPLRESGRGNHYAFEAASYFALGHFSFGPKGIYQVPLVGPIDPVEGGIDAANGIFYPAVTLRNVLDDPFIVRENRETIAGQFTFVYDPTPATWFWMWDRIDRETSPFAMALRSTYIGIAQTAQDARVAILPMVYKGKLIQVACRHETVGELS